MTVTDGPFGPDAGGSPELRCSSRTDPHLPTPLGDAGECTFEFAAALPSGQAVENPGAADGDLGARGESGSLVFGCVGQGRSERLEGALGLLVLDAVLACGEREDERQPVPPDCDPIAAVLCLADLETPLGVEYCRR